MIAKLKAFLLHGGDSGLDRRIKLLRLCVSEGKSIDGLVLEAVAVERAIAWAEKEAATRKIETSPTPATAKTEVEKPASSWNEGAWWDSWDWNSRDDRGWEGDECRWEKSKEADAQQQEGRNADQANPQMWNNLGAERGSDEG